MNQRDARGKRPPLQAWLNAAVGSFRKHDYSSLLDFSNCLAAANGQAAACFGRQHCTKTPTWRRELIFTAEDSTVGIWCPRRQYGDQGSCASMEKLKSPRKTFGPGPVGISFGQ